MIRSRSGFRALPITLAFIFNIVAPVFSAAAPSAPLGPLAQAPQTVAALANPDHVSFTLEGCRNPSVALPNANGFVCADGDYTTGNLGKTWNELDLVPHRLTANAGTSAPASQTYTMGIAADSMNAGHPGYDVITVPVLNASKSDPSCVLSVGGQQTITPGVGGTGSSIGRLLTITQNQNTTCVLDWAERLALGSHLFPGSSLHTNATDYSFSTQGIGARDVSIPVKEILPQELSKTMSATRGQTYSWSISKQANPTSLAFLNTCADTQGVLSAQVAITVTWTRSGPSASGDTTVTTVITATNPAHRTITVSVEDKIYTGSNQSNLIDTATSGPVDVLAATSAVVLTHTKAYSGTATSFNDVATATYTDKDTGIAVPGNTQATASATTQASNGPIQFASATVSDSESISGAGLSFSVATPSIGSFSGYTAGASTTGPVSWSADINGSGSVTFNKTVAVSAPMITSGSLDDTATITSEEHQFDQKSLSVPITADATVSLTISKLIPADSLSGQQTALFTFDITGPDGYSATRTLSFSAGDTFKSLSISDLAPGTYTVHERPLAGWANQSDQNVDLNLPICSGTAAFSNTPHPDISVEKSTSTKVVSAGDPVAYQIVVSAGGVGASHDVTLEDALPALASGSWSAAIVSPDGDDSCSITSNVLTCSFGDMANGSSKTVNLSATSSSGDCPGFENSVTVSSDNDSNSENNTAGPVSITVNCPDLTATKTADEPSTVSAGTQIGFTIDVSNSDAEGTGTAKDVKINDPLPAGSDLNWSISPTYSGPGSCSISGAVGAQTLNCSFGDLAPGASASVHVVSNTTKSDCDTYLNVASVTASNHAELKPQASTTVECPGLNISKVAEKNPINGGDTASFDIVVWNTGPGSALNVTLHDPLPALAGGGTWTENSTACSITDGTLDCSFGNLGVTTKDNSSARVTVSTETMRDDCGTLDNTAFAEADNNDQIQASASITVACPVIQIVKSNNRPDPVLPGTVVSYSLKVTVSDGPATSVTVVDTLPAGLDAPTSISDSGVWDSGSRTITWHFASLADGDKLLSYQAAISAGDTHGQTVTNNVYVTSSNTQCPNVEVLATACKASSTVTVRVPTLVIAKAASTHEVHRVFNADGSLKSVTPANGQITWTLTYTLANGPVDNAVISDPIPAFLTYVDGSASNGGVYNAGTRTITWTFPTLSDSGSVTFQTTTDPNAPEGRPIVNVTTIVSDQTAPDSGQDSITVTSEQVEAGTSSPSPSLPNSALGVGPVGQPVSIPLSLILLVFLLGLGGLTFANVRAVRRRR